MTNNRAGPPGGKAAHAEAIARAAHATQLEKLTGDPYIKHIERVVALVTSDDEKATAWLHDIIEDTPTTADDLRAAGVDEAIIKAVLLLSRSKTEVYADYIKRLKHSGDKLAIAVKRADLIDHLRPVSYAVPERLTLKYKPAIAELS